jgi:cytochrome P450
MRISPSVGAILRRQIRRGGLDTDGEWLPEVINVGVLAYSMHYNEAYFLDPFDFKPERWLEERTSRDAPILAHSAFTPFGYGYTSCVGKYRTCQEIAIILVKMIWVYDLRLQPGTSLGLVLKRWENADKEGRSFKQIRNLSVVMTGQ